jgi:hypothetical protein
MSSEEFVGNSWNRPKKRVPRCSALRGFSRSGEMAPAAAMAAEAQTSGLTDLSRAIENGGALLKAAPFPSDRSVLNLVGNGEDNVGEGPKRREMRWLHPAARSAA